MDIYKTIEKFREHLELLKTPAGYRPENIGQFGGFLERYGDVILEELEMADAYKMAADVTASNAALTIQYLRDTLHAAEEEMQALKTMNGKLKQIREIK